jgi:OFA family oxalate/formate antiporter-like MFS transporter
VPIANMIHSSGYESTFMTFGLIQGGVVVLLSFLLATPAKGQLPVMKARIAQTRRDYAPSEMLRSPVFWVMYAMFVMVASGGLLATAQLAPIAADFKIGDTPVSLLGLTMPALIFALSLDRVLNGVTRPFFGWVSDHIGRENTMFIAFFLEAVGIVMLMEFGHDPVAFVILTAMVFFAWGEIYSLFPATCGDTFGSRYATTNAGLLYTAKGTASLVVPLASIAVAQLGSWDVVFIFAALVNVVAAVLAMFVLKPMRARALEQARAGMTPEGEPRLAS